MSAPAGAGAGAAPMSSGPPYAPTTALLGGLPTVPIDDPISGVILFLFVCAAVTNMTIFQINLRREHKFVFSALVFGFCMARIVAMIMRIVWASRPTNVNIAIAANVFTAAGVVILFIVNIMFSHRIVRAYHPHIGWHRLVSLFFRFLVFSVIALLIMVITCTVDTFFTLDNNSRRIDRDVQLVAGTYLAALAFIPIPIVIIAGLTPRKARVEKFGSGRFRTKIRLLLFTATLLSLGAGFRIGVNFAPRPINDPAWYHSRVCYYCFNYVIELIVVYTYTITRFDRRFHVPNGSRGPGDYAGGLQKRPSVADRVNREEDFYGPADGEADTLGNGTAPPAGAQLDEELAWEDRARKELGENTLAPDS